MITNQDNQSSKLFDRKCEKLYVDTMKRSETKVLFLQHLDQDFNSIFDNVHEVFDAIVKRLNYLAFVIDLAGAYIHENFFYNSFNQKTILKRYLVNYNKHQDVLLQNNYFKDLSQYDKTM